MTRLEHLLIIFAEECGEMQKEIFKALRFGIDEQRDLPTSNYERIQAEFNDFEGVRELLKREGYPLVPEINAIFRKMDKVETYLRYSEECGTLDSTETGT